MGVLGGGVSINVLSQLLFMTATPLCLQSLPNNAHVAVHSHTMNHLIKLSSLAEFSLQSLSLMYCIYAH